MHDDEESGGTAPCFAHELVGGHAVDPAVRRDVGRFRKAERARLYALRKDMGQAAQKEEAARVIAELEALLPDLSGKVVAGYWPIRGELDLRPWMTRIHETGAQVALPVVEEKGRPVAFHAWAPRCAMTRGIWNIPVPRDAAARTPDVVIVPLLGVDGACYRLGNGGGYYDMTLAALAHRPRIIAVGQGFCRIDTIFPQPWDVPMDMAVLGDGTVLRHELA